MARAKIFDPDSPEELIRGWALHVRKAWRKHERAARRLDKMRYWLGVPAVIIAAIVGASVIASLEAQFGAWVTIAVGVGSIVASALAGLQTFLAHAERAEKHRAVGVEYKAALRELEEKMAQNLPTGKLSAEGSELESWLDAMRGRLDDLERKAPIVPDRVHDRVEKEFTNFKFVGSAEELATWESPPDAAAAQPLGPDSHPEG